MAKSLFVFSIQSKSDVITNSSSELFVFNDQKRNSVDEIVTLMDSIYPEWRTEYCDPITADKCSKDDLDWIIDGLDLGSTRWIDWWYLPKEKFDQLKEKELLDEFKLPKLLGLTPKQTYKNWENWCPCCYETESKFEYYGDHYLHLKSSAYKKLREYCKNNNIIAMFSYDENPNWEKQQIIMNYAIRVHMG